MVSDGVRIREDEFTKVVIYVCSDAWKGSVFHQVFTQLQMSFLGGQMKRAYTSLMKTKQIQYQVQT